LSNERADPRVKVMVVDDEAIVADCLAAMLTDAGYDVTTFNNPKLALAELAREPEAWALVVTDQRMPGMNGDVLAKAMRERRPDLPIVLSSGYGEDTSAARMRALGVDAFIPKPYDIDAAVETVRAVIEARRGSG